GLDGRLVPRLEPSELMCDRPLARGHPLSPAEPSVIRLAAERRCPARLRPPPTRSPRLGIIELGTRGPVPEDHIRSLAPSPGGRPRAGRSASTSAVGLASRAVAMAARNLRVVASPNARGRDAGR